MKGSKGRAWRAMLILGVLLGSLPVVAWGAPKVPEKLVYNLSWTGIDVGTATQEITDVGPLRRIVSTARSNDWLSVFYPVEDRIESTVVPDKGPFPGQSLRYRMQMREGNRRRDRELVFERDKGMALYIDHLGNERKEVPISPETFDVYASSYYVRHLPLEVGKPVSVSILDNKETRTVQIQVLRTEKIMTILGKVETIVIKPLVPSKGVFEGKGEVTIWLTDDERRIPVRAKTKVTVGSVTAELIEMQ